MTVMKAILLAGILLTGCTKSTDNKVVSKYPKPVVKFGFITFDRYDGRLNFVPLKDSSKVFVSPQDFKTELLNTGFGFSPSQRVSDEIKLLPHYTVTNDLHDFRLIKYKGTSSYIPARIVYELDADGRDVLYSKGLSDTIKYGEGRYGKPGRNIRCIIKFPGADVLKVGPLN